MPRSHYDTLGVPNDADADQIRRAHRSLARRLHPDVNPGKDAAARFGEVQKAYEVLADTSARAAYDRTLDRDMTPSSGGAHYSWSNIASPSGARGSLENDPAFEELFEDVWRVFFEPRARQRAARNGERASRA